MKAPSIESIDPVALGLTAEGVRALCDTHLERASALLETVKSLGSRPDPELQFDNVLGPIDALTLELSVGAGFPALMAVGHPDKTVRDAAKECEPKVEKFHTSMMLDKDFARVIQRYAGQKEPLNGTRARLLRELQRDLRRNGLDLKAEDQQRLRDLNDELTKLQQEFTTNISDAVESIKVKPSQLKGLPPSFLEQHPADAEGLVTVTTDYPDYFAVITYCEDRSVARELAAKFDNRAASRNTEILKRVLDLREQKAKLLGYATWADYAIEPRMARDPETVRTFLNTLSKEIDSPAREEYKLFEQERKRLGLSTANAIQNHDRLYLEQKLRERSFGYDAKKLSEFFEVTSVTDGLLKTVAQLYGIEFVDAKDAPRWHSDVRVLDVREAGKPLGRIYLDLYPREGKYKHAAMFEIRAGKQLKSGEYLPPIAALMCNFPRPGEAPALMNHGDVVTFFHEFGHVLHHVLTREELATYAGTNTARDFVETPSQMFEEWAYRRETLDRFAKHYRTGERIPEELFGALVRSRALGRALSTERQLSLARLDFVLHSSPTPVDPQTVFHHVMKTSQRFAYLPESHFPATFGHLMGYDAGYYSYQWSLVIACDVLTRFEKEGFFNREVASDWRRKVLERGAGADENDLVKAFLGRPHNTKAYGQFLQAK